MKGKINVRTEVRQPRNSTTVQAFLWCHGVPCIAIPFAFARVCKFCQVSMWFWSLASWRSVLEDGMIGRREETVYRGKETMFWGQVTMYWGEEMGRNEETVFSGEETMYWGQEMMYLGDETMYWGQKSSLVVTHLDSSVWRWIFV